MLFIMVCSFFCFSSCKNEDIINREENILECEHEYSDYIITDIDDIGYRKETYCKKCHATTNQIYIYTQNITYDLTEDKKGSYVKSVETQEETEIVLRKTYKNRPLIGIGNDAFKNYESINTVIIPESVKEIGNYAFYNCSALISIDIPTDVIKIGDYAFYNCGSLTNIEIPSKITEIGDYVFNNCNSLTCVNWNAENCISGRYPFQKSYNLLTVNFGNNVKSIPNYLFGKCNLKNVNMGINIQSIGNGAFEDCDLTSVNIPNNVTSIGFGAFWACPLKSVVFSSPNSWFKTESASSWENKSGGVATDMTDPKTNAQNLSPGLCYWYKIS